ncbi:HDOD domain-containing protein [Amphritea sp. 1_MG-2023]|uniref:HDOD domain-containing protein n=1 Tax=Amphritea sp. 1_MG-2023 TaxID=3062670 RepID=UPI0026E13E0C|nr:HDOD domain-containing protein [Amphritea sp. 1_MG-2023]MDO6564839.1 HDOD domain-containing protein [Amphritea sp. 1_MG-2023]
MSEQQTPQNADQWFRFLSDKQPPVRSSVIKRFQRMLSDQNCSIILLSRFIKTDPLLCFYVALSAGKLHSEKKSEVTSLDHAIGSLGIRKLEQLINSLPTTRLNPASTAQKMYFRSVANSHHAAIQTQQWLNQCRGGMFAEESYQAALFCNIGHWLLWYFAPRQMSNIQILIREKQISPELAEARILGSSIDAISKRLLSHWPVSSLARITQETSSPLNKQMIIQLHQRALGDPRLQGDQLRQLNHLTQQKFFPVKLSNWLAFASHYSWKSESTLQLIDIINDYLRAELHHTCALLHKNCATAARLYAVPGTLSPAAEMLMLDADLAPAYRLTPSDNKLFDLSLKSDHLRQPNSTNATHSRPQQTSSAAPSIANSVTTSVDDKDKITVQETSRPDPLAAANDCFNRDTYQAYLAKFNTLGDSYTRGQQILTDLIKGLVQGVGIQRVALNILPTSSNTLKVIKTTGFESGHPLPHSIHQLAPNSLFHRLNEKPACLLITAANRQQVDTLLPASFRSSVSQQNYLFMSLITANRSVVIIYADRDGAPDGVQDIHHQHFKALCLAAGRCLKQLYTLRAGSLK